jgi:hypothetical protein
LSAGGFSWSGGVGISYFLSFLASLGGINSVVTFFLGRGGFLMRVNCSVLVVVTGALSSSLEVVLLVLVAGFLSSSLEVRVLLLGGVFFGSYCFCCSIVGIGVWSIFLHL